MSYAFSDSGSYYLEDLGVVTFCTVDQATGNETNVMVYSAVHGLLRASKTVLLETAALAFETITIDVGVGTRIDLSIPYDRDLPVANALQSLPLRTQTRLQHLHIEIKNPNSLTLWLLVSFAMLFVDEDYLFRPVRANAQREGLRKAGESRMAERARDLRAEEDMPEEPPNLDDDRRFVEDFLGTDALNRLMHPHFSTISRRDVACGLMVTYSAQEVEAEEFALVHVPETGWQFPKAADIANLIHLVQSVGEECARKGIKDEATVRKMVWMELVDLDSPLRPNRDLVVYSIFETLIRRRLPDQDAITLTDLVPYWAKEMGYAERGRRQE
ncbi:hypothetical protein KC316_g4892 [Hortaea werneckii]|nr:hypothetical protein KC324_g5733 [Hortaea werneckii]KAI7587698.1 hypothetical protein KC316_g4892 [Hortaea werneckii]